MAAHGGSAASSALKGLIQQFTAITGASESVGKHMLEACNNNLEMAVTMFLDGGGIAEEPSTSSASVSTVRPHTEEEVRAPIPQKQEILVEPEPLFGVQAVVSQSSCVGHSFLAHAGIMSLALPTG